MRTASATARVNARSKPHCMPSRSILVSKISPAPSASIWRAHSIASMPVPLRPPWVNTSHFGASSGEPTTRLASIATTMHCEPYLSLASLTNCGLATADEFIDTLSAPALSKRRMSSTLRTPPPTVSGMNTCEATSSMMCKIKSRSSEVAVMSKKVSSSAPCSLYRRAISTGSPASRKPTKFTPLTTRPAVTSRQGIIRFVNIMPSPIAHPRAPAPLRNPNRPSKSRGHRSRPRCLRRSRRRGFQYPPYSTGRPMRSPEWSKPAPI